MSKEISISEWWSKLREDSIKIYKSGYKVDKMIFQFAFLIMVAWFFFVAYHYDFKLNYFECSTIRPITFQNNTFNLTDFNAPNCTNPFYHPVDWTNYKTLPVGTYGQKPTALFYSCYWLPLILFALCFYFNHIIYNGGQHDNGKNNKN